MIFEGLLSDQYIAQFLVFEFYRGFRETKLFDFDDILKAFLVKMTTYEQRVHR